VGMNKLLPTPAALRALTSSALLLCSAGIALARCPGESYPFLDRRGVEYCRQDVVGPQHALLANDGGCAPGTRKLPEADADPRDEPGKAPRRIPRRRALSA